MDYLQYNNSEILNIVFNSYLINNNVSKLREMYNGLQSVKGLISNVQYLYWNEKISSALKEMEK